MKIGIDAQTTLGQKTGFGFYVENLIRELKKIDRQNEYIYFAPRKEEDLSMPERFFWDQVSVPWQARRARVDILHQPCFSLPILFSGKIIATVNDLIAIKFPEDIPFFSRMFFSRWMPLTYQKADHIIAISVNTKKDLIELLKVPEEKISVAYLAASDRFKPARGKVLPPARLNLTQPYFIHIGTLNPRKNLIFLIEVFSQTVKKYPDFQLVLTGKEGWYYEQLYKKVKELGLSDKIIFSGYISDEEKLTLLQGAFGFLFPSVYEGFGLPPLEAMKCGVPVISSNVSSMPEVVGKGGILLPPKDKKIWVKSIEAIIQHSHLRQSLIVRAFQQANQFSWAKNAVQTLEIYQKVYNEPSVKLSFDRELRNTGFFRPSSVFSAENPPLSRQPRSERVFKNNIS